MKPTTRSYNLWIVVQRAQLNGGVWRAYIPALDYFAQAKTPSGAIEAAREVASTLILADLNAGREPTLDEESGKDALTRILLHGWPINLGEVDGSCEDFEALAVNFRVAFVKKHVTVSMPVSVTQEHRLPPPPAKRRSIAAVRP